MSLFESKDFQHLCLVRFRPGETIFSEDDPPGPVYLVHSGEVELFRRRGDTHIRLCRLEKNSVFGEMSLIDGKPRSAGAVALTEVKCYEMDAAAFEERLENLDPFMRGIFRVLVECLRTCTDAITSRAAR